jgi:hypothetical protein
MERINGTVSVAELFEYMRENDLVITKRQQAEVERFRASVLRKRWLKVTDIQKSKLWGDLTKAGILAIIKKLPENEIRFDQHRSKPFYEVSKRIAEVVAEERGII